MKKSFIHISTQIFFDQSKVLRMADRWAVGFLRRVGAFVRRAAMSSMRVRKAISRPGKPPSAHTKRFKKSIRFEIGPDRRSVVIGPMAAKVGETLELGGAVRSAGTSGPKRRMIFRARPFMGPAMKKGLDDIRRQAKDPLPKMWANSVR